MAASEQGWSQGIEQEHPERQGERAKKLKAEATAVEGVGVWSFWVALGTHLRGYMRRATSMPGQ